ncbi:sigma-70 family RNA polymerase sigma factor [Nannocystis sp. RBIL2]|uniref:RNA polymerase sigma factor n=1 Tax=Nannocystis sp. RBIL2 TaxID=2996788 RepID=UPI002272123A|nr:sigma-70 family RNA polymerase sigma factor [Nannocystis sp. RBIL2]MCY1065590.1 sigma-70 family RNA polymerase sigma factor [Nannocystis sp. RBIL2]
MVVSSESDGALFTAWRAGDRSSGDRLFVRHFPTLDRFFRNKVAADQIRDLVHRTFLVCLERPENLRQAANFRAYLLGIAHNILREHYRAGRRDDHDDVEACSAVELGAGPSTLLGAREEERLLLEALRSVPLECQVILELYYWEDLSGPQLAEVLGVPEDTARSRLRRARIRVGEVLERLARSRELLDSTRTNLEVWARSVRPQRSPAT